MGKLYTVFVGGRDDMVCIGTVVDEMYCPVMYTF